MEIGTAFRATSPQDYLAAMGLLRLLPEARAAWPQLNGHAVLTVPGDWTPETVLTTLAQRLEASKAVMTAPSVPLDGSMRVGAAPGTYTADEAAWRAEMEAAAAAGRSAPGTVSRADWLAAVAAALRTTDRGLVWVTTPWDLVRGVGRASFFLGLAAAFESARDRPARGGAVRRSPERRPLAEAVFGPRQMIYPGSLRLELPDEIAIVDGGDGTTRRTASGVVALAAVGITCVPPIVTASPDFEPLAPGWEPTAAGRLPRAVRWALPVTPVGGDALIALQHNDWWGESVDLPGPDGIRDIRGHAWPARGSAQLRVYGAVIARTGKYGLRSMLATGVEIMDRGLVDDLRSIAAPHGVASQLATIWGVAVRTVHRWMAETSPIEHEAAGDIRAWAAMDPVRRAYDIEVRAAAARARAAGLPDEMMD